MAMSFRSFVHPLTGELLEPLGTFRGRLIWPILGASEDDGGSGSGDGSDGDGSGSDPEAGLSEAVKAVLAKERKAARDAVKRASAAEKRAKELEDATKDDATKAAEAAEAASKRADAAEARLLRFEVAAEKGLSLKDARRLVGSTREELEADADEWIKDHPPAKGSTPDPDQGRGSNGNGGTSEAADMNSWMRQAAGRR